MCVGRKRCKGGPAATATAAVPDGRFQHAALMQLVNSRACLLLFPLIRSARREEKKKKHENVNARHKAHYTGSVAKHYTRREKRGWSSVSTDVGACICRIHCVSSFSYRVIKLFFFVVYRKFPFAKYIMRATTT